MDLATLVGLIGGIVIVIVAILLGGNLLTFVDIPSIFIVVGGTSFIVAVKFSLQQLSGTFTITLKAFLNKPTDPNELIDKLVELATTAQRGGGPLALENVKIDDAYLAKGVQMVVDGVETDILRQRMGTAKRMMVARHLEGIRIFRSIAEVGPGMGMIGTLVGLVQMLSNMNDPKTIGPAMAIALLTTLYGSMLANMFANPIADKLQLLTDEENRNKSMIIDALSDLQRGVNPRVIAESLENYLPSSKVAKKRDGGEGAEKKKAA